MSTVGYVDTNDFDVWLKDRGLCISGNSVSLLFRAFDYIELQNYDGEKTEPDQLNEWPRSDFYIDGKIVPSSMVPNQVKNLQMRMAYDMDSGNDPTGVAEQRVKSQSVDGAVSVEYQDGSSKSTISSQSRMLLAKLGVGGVRTVSLG